MFSVLIIVPIKVECHLTGEVSIQLPRVSIQLSIHGDIMANDLMVLCKVLPNQLILDLPIDERVDINCRACQYIDFSGQRPPHVYL